MSYDSELNLTVKYRVFEEYNYYVEDDSHVIEGIGCRVAIRLSWNETAMRPMLIFSALPRFHTRGHFDVLPSESSDTRPIALI